MSERLLGGAGATVDSVPELGAAQASRAAAANPMMWVDFMACLFPLSGKECNWLDRRVVLSHLISRQHWKLPFLQRTFVTLVKDPRLSSAVMGF